MWESWSEKGYFHCFLFWAGGRVMWGLQGRQDQRSQFGAPCESSACTETVRVCRTYGRHYCVDMFFFRLRPWMNRKGRSRDLRQGLISWCMSKVIRFPQHWDKSEKWNQTVECICLRSWGFCWGKKMTNKRRVCRCMAWGMWFDTVTIRENKQSKFTLHWPGTTLELLPDLFPINLSTRWQSESDGSARNSYCLSISPAAVRPVKLCISKAETIHWLLGSTGAS